MGLHELLGHEWMFMEQCCISLKHHQPINIKCVESYYKDGETYDSKFGSMGSAMKSAGLNALECRCALMRLF